MAARSIASLSISFGLVSIPIKLYSATESAAAIHFKLLGRDGSRVRQQYVSDGPSPADPGHVQATEMTATPFRPQLVGRSSANATGSTRNSKSVAADVEPGDVEQLSASASPSLVEAQPVQRSEMLKGFEFEKGKFVTFTPDELKALQAGARETVDIVSFIPERSVDPIYFDKAYYLAPDKRGGKPYSLLLEAMRTTGRCALARWAFRSKEYVVQIRPMAGGLVLQQLLFADEVRSMADLGIDLVVVSEAELTLAKQLIQQISADGYDPATFVDEEKVRILAAVAEKVAGRGVVVPDHPPPTGAQVIDLVEALRASLSRTQPRAATDRQPLGPVAQRKPVRRSGKAEDSPAKGRRKKSVVT